MNTTQDYERAIYNLLDGIHGKYKKWAIKANLKYRTSIQLNIIPGRKYDKIVRDNSVWGFVVKENGTHRGVVVKVGDVLKAAHWKQPAKYVRGSIFESGDEWYNWTGPEYLFQRKARLSERARASIYKEEPDVEVDNK